MKRTLMLVVLLLACSFYLAGNASAQVQGGVVAIDHIDGRGPYTGDTVEAGNNLRIVMRLINDIGVKSDISNGWVIHTPDGAVWDSVTVDSTGPFVFDTWAFSNYFNQALGLNSGVLYGLDGSPTPDTAGILGAGTGSAANRQLPATYNDTGFALVIWFNGEAANNANKHICIDSAFFGVGGTWKWVIPDQDGDFIPEDRYPTWVGETGIPYTDDGFCYLLYDPTLDVSETGDGTLPKEFAVSQNFPNPFNPTTKINFEVPSKSMVNLAVYNVLGQKVATLVDREMTAGKYVADWDGTSDQGASVASGIYFYKFEAGNFVQTKKMVLMK